MVSWVSGQESWLMRLKGLGFLKTWGGEGRVRGGRVTCRNPPQCGQGRQGVQEVLLQQRGPAEPGVVHCHLSFGFGSELSFPPHAILSLTQARYLRSLYSRSSDRMTGRMGGCRER